MLDVRGALLGIVLLGLFAGPPPAQGQTSRPAAPPPGDHWTVLPAPLQAKGRALLAEPSPARRTQLIEALMEEAPADTLEFAILLLTVEKSPQVRAEIVDELEDTSDPRIEAVLERVVATDPDPTIALDALTTLQEKAANRIGRALQERLRRARAAGRREEVAVLARQQERLATVARGGLLPTFMQEPPAIFAVAPPARPIRVLAFGDFGDGSQAQRKVAAALRRYHRDRPFHFALTLGDNFYPAGMESPSDPRWKKLWADLYDPLGIQFYATLGNHDWILPNSPAAEILYSRNSPSWRMPATYYTFTAGPAQFFALDTDVISDKQLDWLTQQLDRSRATWKVVYGHHPIFSEGRHEDNNTKIHQLLPVLRERADVYLAGHDHDMQHLKPEGRLHFFVAGSGGQLRPITPGPRSLFAASAHGFAVLDADPHTLTVTFVDVDLQERYRFTLDAADRQNRP
jgi:tartrate-resistant acid phosphatase type 5